MKNTVTYLIEPLLSQFFLIDAICQGFLDEEGREAIFTELAGIFCVPMNEQTRQYYHAANADVYKNVTDYPSYERLCRTIEFAQAGGQNVGLTPMDRMILAQKRDALIIKAELFKQNKNLTADVIADTLLNTALNGNIDAMVTLSYLEYHGICICADADNAVKRLRLCAKWNNLFGNLMGIAYDSANMTDYYNTLYTILVSSNQREVFRHICDFRAYERDCARKPVARIIENAFALGIVKRNSYDRIFAKVAFSELISTEDKEKLLLSKKKDAVVSLSDIPFDADKCRIFTFDRKKATGIPLEREAELESIFCALSPAIRNRPALYRTALIAGDDDYISQMYATALKNGFGQGAPVVEVDAGTLKPSDFAGAKENFILRGLSESKNSHTVFLITHCDEIGEEELEELVKLLDYEYRRKFKLLEPTVSLDLSDVLLVLFASAVNDKVRRLSAECDVIRTARISGEEKKTVIDSMFRTRSHCYGIADAKLEDGCRTYLASFRTGQILRLIDGALKKAAYDNTTVITAQILKQISDQQNICPGKREFGYIGGGNHEQY